MCDNHICKNTPTDDSYYTCALCKQPQYCSEKCRIMDVPFHGCENLIELASLEHTIAVPYFYENFLAPTELEAVPIDDPIYSSFSVRHANPNRTVSSFIIPSLAEVSAPVLVPSEKSVLPSKGDYEVTVKLNSSAPRTIKGSLVRNVIRKNNDYNERAVRLAALGNRENVLWLDPKEVVRSEKQPLTGTISLALSINGQAKGDPLVAQYAIDMDRYERMSRPVKKMYDKHIDTKFDGLANVATFRIGKEALVSFAVDPVSQTCRLLDVELNPGPREERQLVETRFVCDASDMNRMVGLCMALEYVMANSMATETESASYKNMERSAGVIKNYTHTMMANGGKAPTVIPPEVNTAVANGIDELYEHIGDKAWGACGGAKYWLPIIIKEGGLNLVDLQIAKEINSVSLNNAEILRFKTEGAAHDAKWWTRMSKSGGAARHITARKKHMATLRNIHAVLQDLENGDLKLDQTGAFYEGVGKLSKKLEKFFADQAEMEKKMNMDVKVIRKEQQRIRQEKKQGATAAAEIF